jgi:hypothetical protein
MINLIYVYDYIHPDNVGDSREIDHLIGRPIFPGDVHRKTDSTYYTVFSKRNTG